MLSVIMASLAISVGGLPTGDLGPEVPVSNQQASLPSSWEDFATRYAMQGHLGIWTVKGETKDMWVGIPAGLKYTETSRESFAGDGRSIFGSYSMILDDGTVISTGTGVLSWDDKSGTVLRTNSGFDMGKPYAGISTLKAMDDESITWEYVEKTQGQSTRYENTMRRVGANQMQGSVRRLPDGKPWESVRLRHNPLRDLLQEFDIVGRWEVDTPAGDKNIVVNRLQLDDRILVTQEMRKEADGTMVPTGTGAMWWDNESDGVRLHYLGADGLSVMGEMISLKRSGDAVTMVLRYRGANPGGAAVSTTITRVVKGDTMVSTFSDFSSADFPFKPDWVDVPFQSKRIGRN